MVEAILTSLHLVMKSNIFINQICRPWNIHAPSFLSLTLREIVNAKDDEKDKKKCSLSEWRDKFSFAIPQREEMQIDKNGIAHISVFGTLFNKEAPYFVAGYGGTDYSEIIEDVAVATKEARAIMLNIDSPGGHAQGNDRVAKAISQSRIPVFVHTDGMCCSAAYAIASGASYICASSDAVVGSIGTILPLLDVSGLWEACGVKPDYITNSEGTLKTAGYPPSQSDEERASLQEEIQSFFELFKNHVYENREIASDSMRGQAFIGNVALQHNLIDAVCEKKSCYNKLVSLTR